MREKIGIRKFTLIVGIWLASIGLATNIQAADSPQWRGPDRDGIYKETGLLKEWPVGGPELLLTVEKLGMGFSSPAISNGMIYITGMKMKLEYLLAIDMEGNIKWEKQYGNAYTKSFPEARTTPTVDGDSVYVISGTGEVVCFDAASGEIKWSVPAFTKFEGKQGAWGTAESALIVDNKVIYTPCGDKTTMVALDKATGETIWMTESVGGPSGYASPILVERGGKRLIITVTGNYMLGVNAEDGKIEWKVEYQKVAEGGNDINAPSPIYHDGRAFFTSGYNHAGVMLDISEDGSSASVAWINKDLDTHHGGVVLVDGYLYGSNWINNGKGNWVCVDWETGETMYEKDWNNKGSIISAEGMLYCYEEKDGNLGLVKASPEDFMVVSSFKITLGKKQHWAHPVINDRLLYIRHGGVLMVYDIKAK